jgi:hypothetical protein
MPPTSTRRPALRRDGRPNWLSIGRVPGVMTRVWTLSIACFIGLVLAVWAAPSARATLLIADGQCGGAGGASQCIGTNGTATAVAFQPVEILPGSGTGWANFVSAFKSWNESVEGGDGLWTLDMGTLSPEAALTVVKYLAYVGQGPCAGRPDCGGAQIQVGYSNGGSAPNPISGCTEAVTDLMQCTSGSFPDGDAVWSQSILTDKKASGSQPGNPYLDYPQGFPGASIDPPAYPLQFNDSLLFDTSLRIAPATWLADAWLSTIDSATDTLTVYDGVQWGYTLVLPEPSSIGLLMAGLAALGVVRRRQRAA